MDTGRQAEPNYAAMSVNERLFASGLLDQFDAAVREGDTERMIECLQRVGIEQEHAAQLAQHVLGHPTRYGRLAPP